MLVIAVSPLALVMFSSSSNSVMKRFVPKFKSVFRL